MYHVEYSGITNIIKMNEIIPDNTEAAAEVSVFAECNRRERTVVFGVKNSLWREEPPEKDRVGF